MNKADSERLAGDYHSRGYKKAKSINQADEIIINTCSVRQRAEDRVDGLILNLMSQLQARKPKPKIILTGCMIHHGQNTLLDMFPFVDEILPINEVGFNQEAIRRDKHHAWIPISNGCNSFCSYCIVPFSRGREKSRPMKEILTEIKKLVDQGYSEITLVGQNVNSYGLEKLDIGSRKKLIFTKGKPPFVKLIEKTLEHPEIKKLRFLTSNPWDFPDALIDLIAKHKRIDRFVYLPVQSGSNKILKKMNRGYTHQQYLTLINKIKAKIPKVELGTDIIVGFPGETDKDFQATVDLAKQINFKVAFVAQYSPRPHTVAAKIYQDTVPPAVKKKRWQVLEKLINRKNIKARPQVIK